MLADSPLFRRLRDKAKSIGERAIDDLVSSPERSTIVGEAARRVQDGRLAFDKQAARMVGALGLATQEDIDRLGKKIGRLRKRMRALLERLEDE